MAFEKENIEIIKLLLSIDKLDMNIFNISIHFFIQLNLKYFNEIQIKCFNDIQIKYLNRINFLYL